MGAGIDLLKALAEPTRVRILRLVLTSPVPPCACELADGLLEVPVDISRHVKVLKYADLITERKEGKWVYYQPGPAALRQRAAILSLTKEVVTPTEMASDQQRLKRRLALREGGKCLIGIKNPILLKRLGRA